ncbi:hypothetical protein GALL_327550 [mine drainage metagenome]|uniref:Uncharacterized protein n=1 Tax=mine drainage metagenome TaxID=410659 RepID=A0A1J5R6S8_9ZZZZ
MIDIGAAGARGFFLDDVAGLTLGADEQDAALVGGQVAHMLERVLEHRQCFFEVDDMDLVTVAENVRRHTGIPVTGLVSEVDTGFQHLTHGNGHHVSPSIRLSLHTIQETLIGHPIRERVWEFPFIMKRAAYATIKVCSPSRQNLLHFHGNLY